MESRAFKVYKMACPKSGKMWKFETFGELTICLDSWSRDLSAAMEEKRLEIWTDPVVKDFASFRLLP